MYETLTETFILAIMPAIQKLIMLSQLPEAVIMYTKRYGRIIKNYTIIPASSIKEHLHIRFVHYNKLKKIYCT